MNFCFLDILIGSDDEDTAWSWSDSRRGYSSAPVGWNTLMSRIRQPFTVCLCTACGIGQCVHCSDFTHVVHMRTALKGLLNTIDTLFCMFFNASWLFHQLLHKCRSCGLFFAPRRADGAHKTWSKTSNFHATVRLQFPICVTDFSRIQNVCTHGSEFL